MADESKSPGRLAVPRPALDRAIYVVALVGLLVVVHLWIMVGRGFDRGCFGFSDPTPVVECEAVLQSDAGQLLGVSNTIWGLLFYLLVIGLSLGVAFLPAATSRLLRRARAALLTFGIAYSGYLIYVQSMQLGAYCKLCLMSAGVATVLFGLALADFLTTPKRPQ